MRRGILIVSVACGAVIALAPGAASGGHGDATIVTYTGSPGEGSEISVVAAPGTQNVIRPDADGCAEGFCINDTAGVTEDSPFCMQESPTEVRCVAEGLEAVDIDAGDLKDEVFFPFEDAGPVGADGRFRATVDGGRGGDEMRFATTVGGEEVKYFLAARGGPGPDVVVARLTDLRAIYEYLLLGGAKTDVVKLSNARGTIKGGGAGDKLKGGKGPQKIFGNGGNDRISCGKGRDKADGGPGKDVHLGGCERFASMDEEDFPFN